jgi:nucleotidyltransferase substrate binding protein (TIGR01987 family)
MSGNRKLLDSLNNLRKAVDRLDEALLIPKEQSLALEGTIQRFEVVVELVWKTLQRGLKYEGIHPNTPRETMIEGFSAGWLNDEITWQELLDKRNTSSHEYLDDAFIELYYQEIIKFSPAIRKVLLFLENRFSK